MINRSKEQKGTCFSTLCRPEHHYVCQRPILEEPSPCPKSSKPSKLKTGIIIMIVIIVLLFSISIICPNVNGFTLAKVKRKKVEDEEVPFQKPAAPEQQDDDEEEVETRPWKLVTETAV